MQRNMGRLQVGGLIVDGQEGRLDVGVVEPVLLGVCIYLCMSAFIYCFCQSQVIVRLLPPLLGPIICWLPSNWLRIVSSIWKWSSAQGLWVMQRKEWIRSFGYKWATQNYPTENLFFLLCICGCFIFHCMHFHCGSSNRPCHTGIHIVIDLVSCLQLAVWLWENPSFWGLCFLSCKVKCLYRVISKLSSKQYVKLPDLKVLDAYNLDGETTWLKSLKKCIYKLLLLLLFW